MAALSACTGGTNSTPEQGGIVLQSGTQLNIDLVDVVELGQMEYATISIKSASPNFSTSTVLLDLTAVIRADMNGTNQYKIVLPKSIQNQRPLLITVDLPDLNYQMIDVVYPGVTSVRPGVASTLTYELLKNYPGKLLTDYDANSFEAIKLLVQTKVDQLISESEHLSFASTRFDRLINYFKNGLAFNISFLTAIKSFGIDYGWSVSTPQGLLASDTPEGALTNYQYAGNFTINGNPAPSNPFGHTNNTPRLMPGSASINPGNGIYILEGKKIDISVQSFDIDDDFMDKNFIVQYLPRVLPAAVVSNVVIPEPTPEYRVITDLAKSDEVDNYRSQNIQFNEALDLQFYSADGDTAYRNVYYLISDGMIRIPYRWNFRYIDVNRQPKFLTDANNKINDSSLDTTLAPGEPEFPPGWRQHGSHCETDSNATYTDGGGNLIYYQPIKSRADGPWSCVFKVIDPDLDDDPNAAPDEYAYTVTQIDSFTEVKTNNQYIWPPILPYTLTEPKKVTGTVLPTCVDAQGVTHRKCGQALYQITVDNAVKVAAEQKADLMFNYDVLIYDRVNAGLSTQRTITRNVQFMPIPPRLINFSAPTPGPSVGPLDQLTVDGSGSSVYARHDTYLSELYYLADPGQTLSSIQDIGFSNTLAGTANRGAFLAGTTEALSEYFTQPRGLAGTYATFDAGTGVALDGGAGSIQIYGHSFTSSDASTYKAPREYDSTCNLPENNFSVAEGWDQRAPVGAVQPLQSGGWTFEINAVDYDNVGLRPGEPTDRVYFSSANDIATSLFGALGIIEYCRFNNPNSDILTYQTYGAVGALPAVNPDYCTWQATPPVEMQPIPVFYKVVDAGVTKVRKLVYHRLRLKWRPKDQGLQGKVALDPAGFIKNLMSNVRLNGNRFANNGDTLDRVTAPGTLPLFALRKNMLPCVSEPPFKNQTFHQQAQNPFAVQFNVLDENKVLAAYPFYSGATMGRYEADIAIQGNRSILDTEFLKWLPFMDNCTDRDSTIASGASPTPPPVITGSEPMIFYSRVSDPTHQPRIRLETRTDAVLPSMGGMFCLRHHYSPSSQSGNAYLSVVVIENLNLTTAHTVALDSNCFSRSSITLQPDQKYVAMANRCTGLTLNQVLWADGASTGTVRLVLNETALGFPVGTPISFKLFPSLYQATQSTLKTDLNALYMELKPVDTFVFNSGTGFNEYTGYSQFIPSEPANLGPTPIPATTPFNDFSMSVQYVDWDNGGPGSPLYLTIATPTPNPATSDVFFRPAPGDSTRVQVFVKNRATVTFPIRTSDVPSASQIELDPYDVHQFALGTAVPAPANPPAFSGISRASCTQAPGGYPAIGTLSFSGLTDYRSCQFTWTPSGAGLDDGIRFTYPFTAQDNFGGSLGTMGIGGRHPAANALSIIPSDTLAATNGPPSSFYLDIESLETNLAPFFTSTSGGAAITMPYNSAGGAAGWTGIYAGGLQPTCPSARSIAGYSFDCTLSVANGDTLFNPASINMVEGTNQAFTVYAKDNNVTVALKTLSVVGSRPTQVLIVDGPDAGRSLYVPSFASMSVNTVPNVTAGTATISFNWTPTDAEALLLSNPGGFLIPIRVTDLQYRAAADTGFPNEFVVQPRQSTIWIWAKIQVLNNTPSVFYVNSSNVEFPLSGATIQFQSGTASTFRIRVKDVDRARLQVNSESTGFNPVLSVPPFLTVQPAGTPYISGNFVFQDMVWSGTPSNSDLGLYTSPTLAVTDPRDPSLGLAVNPDGGSPNRARIQPAIDSFTTPFNIQVIGKPILVVPSTTQNQAFAYTGQPFSYPLALSISRPAEMGQPMYIGIDNATAVSPIKRTNVQSGIYITHQHILKWPNPVFTDLLTPPERVIPIYGVRASYCNPGLASPALTLIRLNESTGLMDTPCKLSAADVSNNVSLLQNFTLTLVNGASMPAVPAMNLTESTRNYTPAPTPANFTIALNQQYADFKARCNSLCSYAPITVNTAPSGNTLNPGGATGSVEFSNDFYSGRFQYDTTTGFNVKKINQDSTPTNIRKITATVLKGETLELKATLPSVPTSPFPYYRWYVNGCLKQAGNLNTSTLTYTLPIRGAMAGLNNDCTGQYNINETGSDSLGKLIIRLALVNNTESVVTGTDGATRFYTWTFDVINSDPSLQTDPSVVASAPISINATYYSGTQPSKFAMPVSYGGKSYFAYTDYSGNPGGLRVRFREIAKSGNILTAGAMNLTCSNNFEAQPTWLGIQPHSNGKLYVAASTVMPVFPTGATANLSYGMSGKTCYNNQLTVATPNQNFLNLGGASSVPAGYMAFSRFTQASVPLASYNNVSDAIYRDGVNESNYFMLHDTQSASQFWTYSMSNLYGATPPEFQSPFVNNTVRKTIVNGSNMFQLIGAGANNQTGWKGAILITTIAPNGTLPTKLDATIQHRVAFAGPSAIPAAGPTDCTFDGTPIDGVYDSAEDRLFVLTSSNDGTGKGHFVQIKNATSSPTCSIVGDTLNPSLNASDYNGNMTKMVFDSNRGLIYGVVNQTTGLAGQYYIYDIHTQTLAARDISASIVPYSITYSSENNALYLYDNRRAGATYPVLYRIW